MHAHSVGRYRATTSMIVATADMLMTRVDWSRRLMWTSQTVHSSDPSQLALAIGCAQLKQLRTYNSATLCMMAYSGANKLTTHAISGI